MASAVWTDVVCPLCPLACDDLSVVGAAGGLRLVAGGCARAAERLAAPVSTAGPEIAGRPASRDAAIVAAADLLAAARAPIIGGLGCDVAGLRAAIALAEQVGGIVDHMASAGAGRNVRVLQDAGSWTTSLSELRARADLLLVVGANPLPLLPRLIERCLGEPAPLADGTGARRLVRLGPPTPDGEDHPEMVVMPCAQEDLPAAVALLRALIGGADLGDDALGELPSGALRGLAGDLRAAGYGVVAWSAASMPEPGAELVIESLLGIIRELNLTTRCAGLPLGGEEHVAGANQVSAWQTGLPLPVGFAAGGPEHEPVRMRTDRALGDADLLVWIAALNPVPPPATDVPTIVIGTPGERPATTPAVAIPAATPGIDHRGQLVRMDGFVMLPLTALRESPHPPVAELLGQIGAALADGRA